MERFEARAVNLDTGEELERAIFVGTLEEAEKFFTSKRSCLYEYLLDDSYDVSMELFKSLSINDDEKEEEPKQSIPEGSIVEFHAEGMEADFEDVYDEDDMTADDIVLLNYKLAKATLCTFTELGEKDFEYYDIEFEDGTILEGVSGMHLTPIHKENT